MLVERVYRPEYPLTFSGHGSVGVGESPLSSGISNIWLKVAIVDRSLPTDAHQICGTSLHQHFRAR